MRKDELQSKTDAVINETKVAIQTMYDALNKGQQKKIVKNKDVKALFGRHGIKHEE